MKAQGTIADYGQMKADANGVIMHVASIDDLRGLRIDAPALLLTGDEMKVYSNDLAPNDKFAGFGREIVEWILNRRDWWDEELSEDIMPMLEHWGLAERVQYSIELHGDDIDADEGDEIWWIDPNRWPLLPTEVPRLCADIERIGRERDDMVRANAELQQRLIDLQHMEDDRK